MDRIARARSETGFYHVVSRGNNKRPIFSDDVDRHRFLKLLQDCCAQYDINIIAWCLMSNHVHLLFEDLHGQLSEAMKRLLGGYAAYFNARTGRIGHLFQGRFSSRAIDTDAYLLECVRYIHNNPANAHVAPADIYPWSSYREYMSEANITATGLILDMLDGPEGFSRFVADRDACTYCFEGTRVVSDEDARRIARAIARQRGIDPVLIKDLPHARRADLALAMEGAGLMQRQIAEAIGMSQASVARMLKRRQR